MQEGPPTNDQPDAESPRPDGQRYQPLMIVLVAACVGIVVDRYWPLPVSVWWAICFGAWAVWAGLWWRQWDRTASLVLLLAVASVAGAWHHGRWYLFERDDLGYFARVQRQPACLQAIALKSPRVIPAPDFDPLRPFPVPDRSRLELELVGIRNGASWQPVSGTARLTVDGVLDGIEAGDRIQIFGQLSAPHPPRNPGEFDYAAHVRAFRTRSGVWASFPECVTVVESGSAHSPRRLLDQVRVAGTGLLQKHLDPRRAALASAVLLGVREELESDQTEAFMKTGTIHLLAISGLHVGILAGALLWIVLRLPIRRGVAMAIVAATMFFYMLLTDARPPVIRATILVLVFCAAYASGRRPLRFNALATAALIVLAINPAQLFHIGTQLSFLAVGGLAWFAPWLSGEDEDTTALERLARENESLFSRLLTATGRYVRGIALVSAVIWLLALPLVMARFHLLTPGAVLLNVVLWLPMSVGLLSGFATLVFGGLSAPLGALFGGCCNTMLGLLDSTVSWAQDVPGSHYWVPGPDDWWLWGFYGALGLLAACPRIRPPRRWILAMLAVWAMVGFATSGESPDEPQLNCTFLAMGHGCAVVLELPSGQTVLCDAGRLTSPEMGSRSIAGALWSRGIMHIDAVILSHPDIDHYNALPGLLERFSVGVVYVSPIMFEQDTPALSTLQEAIRRAGVPLKKIHAGDRIDGTAGCSIEVLHPPARGALGDDNANSLVLDVSFLGHRILLPGDLDTPGLEDVLAEEPTDYDVLLAPHHGSRRSNPPGLAAWSTPEWVIVSGTQDRYLEQIERTYGQVGAKILHTGKVGAVRVTIDATGLRVHD